MVSAKSLANLRPKPWVKGQSGNPTGNPPTKAIDEIFRDFLAEVDKSPKGVVQERLRTLMEGQFFAAVKGSTPAAEFIMQRAHGKVKDKLESTVIASVTVDTQEKADRLNRVE